MGMSQQGKPGGQPPNPALGLGTMQSSPPPQGPSGKPTTIAPNPGASVASPGMNYQPPQLGSMQSAPDAGNWGGLSSTLGAMQPQQAALPVPRPNPPPTYNPPAQGSNGHMGIGMGLNTGNVPQPSQMPAQGVGRRGTGVQAIAPSSRGILSGMLRR
jgi:hypothetical protein